MLSISAEFKLSKIDSKSFKRSPQELHKYIESLDFGIPTETSYEKGIKSMIHISLLVGTIVWGYGDLLFK